MLRLWSNRLRRAVHRSPDELLRRLRLEGRSMIDRYRAPPAAGWDEKAFARIFEADDIGALWARIGKSPFPAHVASMPAAQLDQSVPGEIDRILHRAGEALGRRVDLLGSGLVTLASPIEWHADFKTRDDWPVKFFRDLDILNPNRGSDVKVPWELSRLHWLIPVGQAYMLNGDERYAAFVRDILTEWIIANPYGWGVNWAVAMEAAMRIFSWSWLFHVFNNSTAWSDHEFQLGFLKSLYQHAIFCARYLEDFGVNGNHLTADAGGLVFAGLLFGQGKKAESWAEAGWTILERELPRQVSADGVNFEASTAYHRFVAEMFLWPARYRQAMSLDVSSAYRERLSSMAQFTRAYTKPNGDAPLWGDNDNGRVLPFGYQPLNDHGYLPHLLGASAKVSDLGRAELVWVDGPDIEIGTKPEKTESRMFKDAGIYIMASEGNHIFINCGTVGFGGRGGHGHNDCLSFEAVLNGVSLISDSGTYVYTASYEERDRFRGTASHNTPLIDGEEQNRFVSGAELFSLHNDAAPNILEWRTTEKLDYFTASHSGYQRLSEPVTPIRSWILDKVLDRLVIRDSFVGDGHHKIQTPFHFVEGADLSPLAPGQWRIKIGADIFMLIFSDPDDWTADLEEGWISHSYGQKISRPVLQFSRSGDLAPLTVALYPTEHAPESPKDWLVGIIADIYMKGEKIAG